MNTKKTRILIAVLLIMAFAVLAGKPYEADASYSIYCSHCGNKIDSDANYCMYCGSKVSCMPSSNTYGTWSAWSRNPAYPSANLEVETRTVIAGYNMVHYGTQEAAEPHYRMFRDYSIKGSFWYYGARDSYGEKHFTKYVDASAMIWATSYEPGALVKGEYPGYQRGTSTAYNFGDDKYVWFIESVVYATEYRYRSIF